MCLMCLRKHKPAKFGFYLHTAYPHSTYLSHFTHFCHIPQKIKQRTNALLYKLIKTEGYACFFNAAMRSSLSSSCCRRSFLSISTRMGAATNMEEYVATITPIIIAKA